MAASKKKPLTKDDLRKLMKQQRDTNKSSTQRIESPLAKYTSTGQLTCVVCNAPVKNERLWNAHLQGRSHKENVAKLKAEKTARDDAVFTAPNAVAMTTAKRKHSVEEHGDTNKRVCEVASSTQNVQDRPGQPVAALLHKTSPDGTSGSSNSVPSEKVLGQNALPADFFDKGYSPSPAAVEEEASSSSSAPCEPKTMAEQLPEGFFDDPRRDAKVRNVEYKDKMDEEWELFQKAMKEETTVSEAILEEDEDQNTAERNIVEIDDQIQRWSKVDKLQKAKEALMTKAEPVKADSKEFAEEEEVDEEQEFEEFLDWRTKKAWK